MQADTRIPREFFAPRWWPVWCGVGLWRGIARFPLPVITALAAVLGELLYRLHGARRRVALANLAACFPELDVAARRRLARAHFHALITATLAMPIAWFGASERLRRLVRITGGEHIERVFATQRPLILLAPHFVALDLGGMTLAIQYADRFANGYVTMYRAPKNRLFDYLIRVGRLRFGGRLVERHEGIKPVLRELKQGTPLYYLPDQDPGRRGTVFAPFFGVPTATLTTVSRIAASTNAMVVPFFTRLLPHGRGVEAICHAPLSNFPSGDDLADAVRVNAVIEEGVRMMPAQYFWVHKRFKTRPEGISPIYD